MSDSNVDERAPLIFHSSHTPTRVDHRTQLGKKLAVWFILLAVGFERLAFYSLAGNLVLFLTSNVIQWSSAHSVTASLYFFGASYISALLFSWLSDAKLGRAKTILIGFLLYLGGYIFIPLISKEHIFEALCYGKPHRKPEWAPYWEEKCNPQITIALIITAIGVGAVQSNMAIFGAEQIREQRSTTQYFDKYYVAVNTGALLSFGILSYIHQNISWFHGHIISTGLLGFTILCFLLGYKYYIHIKPYDSVISYFIPVFINAFQTWRKHRRHARRITYERRNSNNETQLRDEEEKNDYVSYELNERPKSFLDYAKVANNGRFQDRVVDDIKSLRKIIAMFLLLIPYWIIYLQSETTFIIQGVHMKVPPLASEKRHMPTIWLSLANQIIIILVIFILNTFIYKRLHAKNRSFSMKSRIIFGMLSAVVSMCITGVVEIFRQQRCDLPFHIRNQTVGATSYTAADMSVFYQFPQYVGIGVSEVFTSVASLEFAYLAAPQSAQSLVMSMRFSSTGLSSLLGSAYVNIFQGISKNFTMSNLECKDHNQPALFYIYFFVLAGLQLVFILIFLGCDRKFQLLKASEHRFNTRLFIGSSSRTSHN